MIYKYVMLLKSMSDLECNMTLRYV